MIATERNSEANSPERQLWRAVLDLALSDIDRAAEVGSPQERRVLRHRAVHYFSAGNRDFLDVCEYADLPPCRLIALAQKKIESRKATIRRDGELICKYYEIQRSYKMESGHKLYLKTKQGKIRLYPTHEQRKRLLKMDGKHLVIVGEYDNTIGGRIIALFPHTIAEVKK